MPTMLTLAIAFVLAAGLTATSSAAPPAKTAPKNEDPGRSPATEAKAASKPALTGAAKRGQYLVMVAGCGDCHTPMKAGPNGPVPDMERMFSGHPAGIPDPEGTLGKTDLLLAGPDLTAFKQPFGTVYAANLTPDKTGLADWTEDQFMKTLRTGRHLGEGRAILPPMPWMSAVLMTDQDLRSIWAFLRAIKPIQNAVPYPKVPPPVIEQMAKANAATVEMIKNAPH